jgi:hypothetical protein
MDELQFIDLFERSWQPVTHHQGVRRAVGFPRAARSRSEEAELRDIRRLVCAKAAVAFASRPE